MVTQIVAGRIIKALNGFDEKQMYLQMLKHYKIMRLIDEKGNWRTPELEKNSAFLLPTNMNEIESKRFVEEIAMIAQRNQYLVDFLEKAKNEKWDDLEKKVELEGKEVFPDIVAFSMVLERLTKAMYDNHKIIEDCVDIFQRDRKELNAFKYMNAFHKLKLLSVEGPVKNIFIKAHKTGMVSQNAGSFMVALNIFEATFADYFVTNHKDNAKAGWTLAVNKAGSTKYDSVIGTGPSGWSKDGKAVTLSMPLPKEWADLYQTWNMGFISQIETFQHSLPKLFIPQVANYQENPTSYIYNRALALYVYLNHGAFEEVEHAKSGEPYVEWFSDKLTRLWGECNEISAKKYNEILKSKKLLHVQNAKEIKRLNNYLKADKPRLERDLLKI